MSYLDRKKKKKKPRWDILVWLIYREFVVKGVYLKSLFYKGVGEL